MNLDPNENAFVAMSIMIFVMGMFLSGSLWTFIMVNKWIEAKKINHMLASLYCLNLEEAVKVLKKAGIEIGDQKIFSIRWVNPYLIGENFASILRSQQMDQEACRWVAGVLSTKSSKFKKIFLSGVEDRNKGSRKILEGILKEVEDQKRCSEIKKERDKIIKQGIRALGGNVSKEN